MVSEILAYKSMIKQLAKRDMKLRYERSALGFFWSLLNPLVMIVIYTTFFSLVIRIGIERYAVFLVSALLPWNFLVKSILSVAPTPYQNGYLLNRVAFPAESLVFSAMLSAFADFCLEMPVFTILLAVFRNPLLPGLVAVPIIMLCHLLFSTGIALAFSVAYVFYRDTQYLAGILTTAWLYMSPVFYPLWKVPADLQWLYKLNPMVHILGSFREPLYTGHFPHLSSFTIVVLVSVTTFYLGWSVFNRYKKDFAELL